MRKHSCICFQFFGCVAFVITAKTRWNHLIGCDSHYFFTSIYKRTPFCITLWTIVLKPTTSSFLNRKDMMFKSCRHCYSGLGHLATSERYCLQCQHMQTTQPFQCWRFRACLPHVGLLRQRSWKGSMTSRPLSKNVADVSAFLSNLTKDAYEEENKLVQEHKEGLPIAKACDWHFCIVQSVQLRLQQVEEYSINNEWWQKEMHGDIAITMALQKQRPISENKQA